MQARLKIRLLGTFDVVLDGAPLAGFRSAKVRALLAYLAVETDALHRREALATLLWGEFPERDAQRSLSQALSNLRGLLAPLSPEAAPPGPGMETRPTASAPSEPVLEITGQNVRLRVEPERAWVDVHAFDALLGAAGLRGAAAPEGSAQARLLAQAIDLYRGPFLSGLSLPDSPEFEEWRLLQQEQHHQAALLALERMVDHHLAEGHTDEVERFARRQLGLEPWNEVAHQSLMLALALSGRRGAALRQFETCRSVLADELGVEPSAETEALRRQIRDGTWNDLAPPARSPAGAFSGLSPSAFVSRERETARLEHFLDLALAGQGHVVLVTGEAGTGKTALLAHFAKRAVTAHRRLVATAGRCSAFAGLGDPLLPFREILQGLCCEASSVSAGSSQNPDHMRRLWALFPSAAQALVEHGPDLVGRFVPVEDLEARAATLAPPGASWLARLAELKVARSGDRPQRAALQEALFDQVTRVLLTIARRQPLLLLIDDLQWADAASLSLLFHLGRQLTASRILVVGAYRPSEAVQEDPGKDPTGLPRPLGSMAHEFARQWGDIRIDLDRAGGRRFVDALLDAEPNRLGEAFRERLTRHTGGHPLFTVEMLRAFQERGELVLDEEERWVEGPAPHGEGLPARVEAVIGERIDRLPRAWRRVLEAACIEGETFSAEVAARATGTEPAWVRELLSGPLSAESRLVQPLGVQLLGDTGGALSRYRFGHALFHEYLCCHMDAVQRSRLHAEVGGALETLCRGEQVALAEVSPQLAHHYEEAGLAGQAAHFLLLAGRRATRLTAYSEAISLYQRGLAQLEQVPGSDERSRRQIELYLALDTPLYAARGWGAPERAQLLHHAHRLARRLDEPEPLMRVLLLLTDIHTWLGEDLQALQCAEELLCRAEVEQDTFYLAAGHLAAGLSNLPQGHLAAGRIHLERAWALGSPGAGQPAAQGPAEQRPVRPPLLPVADTDLAATALTWLSTTLFLMGYGDQALSASRRALARVDELADPLTSLLVVMVAGAAFHAIRGDATASQAESERLLAVTDRYGLPLGKGWAVFFRGWAQVDRGEETDGLAAMRTSLKIVHGGGAQAFRPMLHCLMAEALLRAGQAGEGLEVLADVGPHAGRVFEAEVHRLRGELLLKADHGPQTIDRGPSSAAEAEVCFRRALEVARRQETHLFELRAAMSLARLWQAQGRSDEARELVAGAYAWFSEGFDLRDLAQARAML